MKNIVRIAAAVFGAMGFLRSETIPALADGYYDATWIGNGRITFQGDEIGFDQVYPPGANSAVSQIHVGANGDLVLFGFASSDTWIGGLHADGNWVLTFGPSNGFGRTTLCYLAICDAFRSAAVQPDGRYIILGQSEFVRTSTLANTYTDLLSSTSVVINNVAGHVDATAVAVQSDGKVLVGGMGYASQADTVVKFGVARFVAAGFTIDPTFNSTTVGDATYAGGTVVPSILGYDEITEVLVQADGRIVLVGFGAVAYLSYGLEVARLNADGTLDATFGNSGTASFTWPSGVIKGIGRPKMDRAGRILVPLLGDTTAFGNRIMVLARVTAAGALDGSFGQDAGFARFSISGDCTSINANAVDVDSAGRILVAGDCYTPTGADYFIVIRLRGDTGYLDASFGINGYGLGAFGDGHTFEFGKSVAFDSSGRPIVGGESEQHAGVARLTYDLIRANDFELAARGCLPPDCN